MAEGPSSGCEIKLIYERIEAVYVAQDCRVQPAGQHLDGVVVLICLPGSGVCSGGGKGVGDVDDIFRIRFDGLVLFQKKLGIVV